MHESALYDEAVGPQSPHTITYREDYAWEEEQVDDIDTLILNMSVIDGDLDKAADMHARLMMAAA